jgi:hypothetical protein
LKLNKKNSKRAKFLKINYNRKWYLPEAAADTAAEADAAAAEASTETDAKLPEAAEALN